MNAMERRAKARAYHLVLADAIAERDRLNALIEYLQPKVETSHIEEKNQVLRNYSSVKKHAVRLHKDAEVIGANNLQEALHILLKREQHELTTTDLVRLLKQAGRPATRASIWGALTKVDGLEKTSIGHYKLKAVKGETIQ
jgi:hypothetical protein